MPAKKQQQTPHKRLPYQTAPQQPGILAQLAELRQDLDRWKGRTRAAEAALEQLQRQASQQRDAIALHNRELRVVAETLGFRGAA